MTSSVYLYQKSNHHDQQFWERLVKPYQDQEKDGIKVFEILIVFIKIRQVEIIFISQKRKQINYRRRLSRQSIYFSILHSKRQRQEKNYGLPEACIWKAWRSSWREKQSQPYLYKLGSGQGWERVKTRWDKRKGKCWLGISWSVNSLDTFRIIIGPAILKVTCSHWV